MASWTVDESAAAHPRRAGHPAGRPADHGPAQCGRHRRSRPGGDHPSQPPTGDHRGAPRRSPLGPPATGRRLAGPVLVARPPAQRVDVSIAVPANVLADLRLVDGAVIVSGLRETTRVNVTSGQVTLMGLAGQTSAKLVSGPVEALGVAGDLTLETVSGELVVADSSAARVRATTISGAITCDLDNPRRQRHPAQHHLRQRHRTGPRGQRPGGRSAHHLRPDHQRVPAAGNGRPALVQEQSRGARRRRRAGSRPTASRAASPCWPDRWTRRGQRRRGQRRTDDQRGAA